MLKRCEIYLIRHGECETNEIQESLPLESKLIWGRNVWSELTPKGITQSKLAGLYFKQERIFLDKIVSSSAVRAQQTARYSTEELFDKEDFYAKMRDMGVTDKLLEQSMGDWELRKRSDIIPTGLYITSSEDVEKLWYERPPNGESPDDVASRVIGYIKSDILNQGYESIGLFTHRCAIAWSIALLAGIGGKEAYNLYLGNGSVSKLTFESDKLTKFEPEIFVPVVKG